MPEAAPLAIGVAAEVLIAFGILSAAILFYLTFSARSLVENWPFLGARIKDALNWLADREEELARQVINASVNVTAWALKLMTDAITWLIQNVGGLAGTVLNDIRLYFDQLRNVIIPNHERRLIATEQAVANVATQHVAPLEQAVTRLAGTVAVLTTSVIPRLQTAGADLAADVNALRYVVTHTLSQAIQAVAVQTARTQEAVTKVVLPRIAAIEHDFTLLVTRPVSGLVARTGTLERDMARVLPIAGVLAISADATLNLTRLARNPCWCQTVGPRRDESFLALAELFDLL